MPTTAHRLDTTELEQRVKNMYEAVAREPNHEFRMRHLQRRYQPLARHTSAVFAAAARALRPGGRLALADMVTTTQLPEGVTCDASLWAACIGGAMQCHDDRQAIDAAGFTIGGPPCPGKLPSSAPERVL